MNDDEKELLKNLDLIMNMDLIQNEHEWEVIHNLDEAEQTAPVEKLEEQE